MLYVVFYSSGHITQSLLWVPPSEGDALKKKVIDQFHGKAGHFGINKVHSEIKKNYANITQEDVKLSLKVLLIYFFC
jgi:hypothetical protein